MKILITAGATREPIDAVRFISNVSTGTTGAALADAFTARDHAVLLLRGAASAIPKSACETEVFSSAADLRERLRRRLAAERFDAVIMAAAVADYRPAEARADKMSSDPERLVLSLTRNEKILPQLKAFAGSHPPIVIGFKLTVGADKAERMRAVLGQFASGKVDVVVHNDLQEIRASAVHPFRIYTGGNAAPVEVQGAVQLAASLATICAKHR